MGLRVLGDTFDSIIKPQNLREFLKRDPVHSRLKLLRKEGVPVLKLQYTGVNCILPHPLKCHLQTLNSLVVAAARKRK